MWLQCRFIWKHFFAYKGRKRALNNTKWILPSFSANVEYLPIADIDFTSAASKKQKLDDKINNVGETSSTLETVEVKTACDDTLPMVKR